MGSRNPDPKIAALEAELKDLGNNIGMGAMGFMGTSMVVDCHIEVGYCHTGGMPMSVHMFCLSSRRATARVFPDGRAEFRTDPEWFTDYMRRATVGVGGAGNDQAAEGDFAPPQVDALRQTIAAEHVKPCRSVPTPKSGFAGVSPLQTPDDRTGALAIPATPHKAKGRLCEA